jgi:hypothetical protein
VVDFYFLLHQILQNLKYIFQKSFYIEIASSFCNSHPIHFPPKLPPFYIMLFLSLLYKTIIFQNLKYIFQKSFYIEIASSFCNSHPIHFPPKLPPFYIMLFLSLLYRTKRVINYSTTWETFGRHITNVYLSHRGLT